MRRIKIAALVALTVAAATLLTLNGLGRVESNPEEDPDLPPEFIGPRNIDFSKEEFMTLRAEGIALKRGISKDAPTDPKARQTALRQMDQQRALVARMPPSPITDALLAAWIPLGPAPIPNGQTVDITTPVSGRTVAIAVHPTNPNIVYVGAAQGGLYRSTDGGTIWTPLMDNALSLAIGAIAIAPSQPDTVYVGTGEVGFAGDSFFGVGVYRIDNASSGSPIISGPFHDDPANTDIFTGRGIGKIVVHPTLPGTIFVASASGIGGIGGVAYNVLPARGLYRSTDATSADPTFTKMTMTGPAAADRAIVDVVMDPGNPSLVVCSLVDTFALGEGGVFRSTDALSATPTFTRTFVAGTGTSNSRTELALHRDTGTGTVTIYAASGFNGGTLQRSTDGGATWAEQIDNDFCTPQCFYDIAVAVDPTNVSRVYLGGAPALPFGFSTTAGTSFTVSSTGLHVDSHAIAVAPSLPSTIYFSSDGGIYKSINSGASWTPLNNTQYSATQFVSLALHPIDRNFTIGGTQDNGTNFYQPSQLWTKTEGGDGGYAVIDQNAGNTTTVTMYHTFFNRTNTMGYSRSLNAGTSWSSFGCGSGQTANGMTCTATAILFYAPMERGPGNPNTLYFGSDVLYRSTDSGLTVTKVSQEPIQVGVAISAIGISPQNDNIRIVGQNNGNIFGTNTGSSTLVDLDASGVVPSNFIARAVVDPNSSTTAYVTLSAFGVTNVWKTTNLGAANPTWTAAASGLPQVPVSAFVIDPQNSNALYAGTDIGVYQSLDGGASWLPFGTNLPRVAVFDAEISNVHRILRIATHGRGLYEIQIPGTLLPVPRPAGDGSSGSGGASAIVTESCVNGAIDPSESVTVSYAIQNVGGGPTTNLVATLQATGGVTSPGAAQNYGAIAPTATVSRNFTFTASGSCGSTITLTFQLQDGATNFGTLSVTYILGALVSSPTTFTQNFDGVVAPALPSGWTTAQTGTAPLWATTTSFSNTTPNSVATNGTTTPGDNSLTSPIIPIPAPPGTGVSPTVQLSFRNNFDTESGYDGGVLEISINGGAFADIIAAGGSFATGGYNGTIGVTDSVLTGQPAWTGNSNGFITTSVNLPPASFSQNAQLRWRTAYDTGTNPTGGGMRVDTISIYPLTRTCCGPSPTPTPSSTPTSTPTPTLTPTPSPSPTRTPTPTPSLTPSPSPTSSPTPTPLACGTYSTVFFGGSMVPGTVDIGNHTDDDSTGIALPFPYTLYDQTFVSASVGSNGHLTFGTVDNAFNPGCIPIPTITYAILPFETDLCTGACNGVVGTNLGIFTSISGSAPNRVFNIEWRAAYYNSGQTTGIPINFEVRLFEGQTFFDVIYGTVPASFTPPSSRTLSLGVQRTNKTKFTLTGCDTTGGSSPPVGSGQRHRYTLGPACPCGPGSWTSAANYPSVIESPAVGSDGTFAYSAGGYNGAPTNALYRYDPAANSWAVLSSMPASMYAARGVYAATTNSFYVFGGYNGAVLNSTYRYNVSTNTWSIVAPMPAARYFPNVVYYAATGKIYVIGGFDSVSFEANQTWEYDPVANTWNTSRANIPVAMAGSGTSIAGQFIYLAGAYAGATGSTLHYRYDIVANTWSTMSPVPVNIFSPITGTIGGQIYVTGGGNPSRPAPGPDEAVPRGIRATAPDTSYNTTYIYNIAGNSWTSGPNTNFPHSFTAGATIGNTLLVVGGYNGTTDTNAVEVNIVTPCATPTPTPCPTSYRVLIVYADSAVPNTLPAALAAEPGIASVTLFNGAAGTPTLGQLQQYDIVVPWSNPGWFDQTTLGNNLGSYLAGGGIVVAFNFDWYGGTASILGTWLTNYSPFSSPGTTNFTAGTLGTCTLTQLCAGVSSLNAFYRQTLTLTTGSTLAGTWNDGTPMIAWKGRAIGISAYVGDSPANFSGQFSRVIANAGLWLSPPCTTPTPTPTATPTPTPPPLVSISGTVVYCSNPSLNPVPSVTMTLTGSASGTALTNASGNYSFASLVAGGSYTITPTKTALAPGSTGISTVDVLGAQRHFLGITIIPLGCRLTAADVNADSAVTTIDVVAIQRFFLGFTTSIANVGKYNFNPVNRSYPAISGNQTAQNYDALVFGDVSSNFVHRPEGASPDLPDPNEIAATVALVSLPEIAIDQSHKEIRASVTTTTIDRKDKLVGFQGDFTFDERVITFASNPVHRAGLTAGNWNVSGNVLTGPGPIRTLRVSAYSTDFRPLSGNGVLFELNMTTKGSSPPNTPLLWASPPNQFLFIDADLNTQRPISAASGKVVIQPSRE